MSRHQASERQVSAAHPHTSTWLSANAGSGKTRVLTDRVARLLLAGVEPARILCLTYTKAAASEMQNRLFRRLGEWAMKEDAALRDALHELGMARDVPGDTLSEARRLFARAIETPGGLRIQTIHSFCATLLRRFPLEAGVSPQFTELDGRAASLLRDEIIEEMAESLAPELIASLARAYTGEDFARLAAEVAGQRTHFAPPLDAAACRALFDVPESETIAAILGDVILGDEITWMPEVIALTARGSKTDVQTAGRLAAMDFTAPSAALMEAMEDLFLFGEKTKAPFTAKVESLPTKDIRAALGPLGEKLAQLMRRVEDARARRIALHAAERSAAIHSFARVFLPEYATRKMARGALDFDDLITRAKALLTDPQVAQWVLFRLDGGIDHILVDEAQDTSPDQWKVIELLAQEFTSGLGARDVERTIFVVGDQKQSIYSFQGADVAAFAAMRGTFDERLTAIGAPFQKLELEYSFRSSPAILRLVDQTFDEGLHTDLGGASHHIAFRNDMPGRIELWPPIEPAANPEDEDWTNPIDLITGEHHAAELGRKVAERIKAILDAGTMIPENGGFRPAHAGDFLILVRRRSALFSEIIRACKAARLPIAGADRLKLGAELAVKDLASLLAFLATPEDDLALAEVLRSPLFGWSETQLYRLARPRKGYLWEALRNSGDEHAPTLHILHDLRDLADFLRPYDLIERALTRHDGRRKLLARLGAEAEDGIDELLSQALAYERNDVPSLTGFLTWLQTDDVEVKRQMDSAGHRIRVMTVHGAKGLEAPIVILPDTADPRYQDKDELFRLSDGQIAWRTAAKESPDAIRAIRRQRREKTRAENMRLLYVALTRAQSWLIVAAAGELASRKAKKTKGDDEAQIPAWYDLIEAGMQRLGAARLPDGTLHHAEGAWPAGSAAATPDAQAGAPLPAWAETMPPPAPRPQQTLSPSDLGGAKVLFGDHDGDSEGAKLRGTLLHLLLEHLPRHPQGDWPRIAAALLPPDAPIEGLLDEASGVIRHPDLVALFADGLAEVSVTAEIDGQAMLGTIDRLIVAPDRVLAVDFKSNVLTPDNPADIPESILRQLAAYRHALRQIYPDRRIETAVLWTRTARLMPVA